MDFSKLEVSQLLKSLLYAVVPILVFSAIGIAVAALLMKMSKDKKAKREAEEQARLKELREKQKIERMSDYYKKLREKGQKDQAIENEPS